MLNYIILEYGNTVCLPDWDSIGDTVNYHKIYYCISGSAIYQDESQTLRLTPGKLYIFPQNVPYQIVHSEENHFHVLWFHADSHLPLVSRVYETEIPPDGLSNSLLRSLSCAVSTNPNLIGDLLPIFIKTLDIPSSAGHIHSQPLWNCISYIHGHLSDSITNDTLAALSGYHKHYLIQIFREELGTTPRQYIIRTKFNYAKQFLYSGKSVSECAHLIGYSNDSDFSRDFKTLFSVSPSQYKKQLGTP